MKEVRRFCDRCGAVLTDQPGSVLQVKAGELAGSLPEEGRSVL